MANTKERVELIKENKLLKQQLKDTKLELNVANDTIAGLSNENEELGGKLEKLYRDGALGYAVNENGFLINMSVLNSYSERTFIQDIPEELAKAYGTKLYHDTPFAKVTNGIIEIDKDEYNKYKRRIIL